MLILHTACVNTLHISMGVLEFLNSREKKRSQVTVNDELLPMRGRLRVSTLVAVKRHATQSFVLTHPIRYT